MAKLRIEALVNGGRNYNGPKVAKFLVGLFGSMASIGHLAYPIAYPTAHTNRWGSG